MIPQKISTPPTPEEWRALVAAIGGEAVAARTLRVDRTSVGHWTAGRRKGMWAVAELLRLTLVNR
jgi:hypothetical protein